ncbi:MAG TPA: hypothetical protein PK797_00955, partial [Burkholderiaceae bacterium]|nr:hypothetical protein [Burkholderiaceae bacterium]
KGNWLDLTHNDFDDLLPVIDKDAKAKAVTKVGRERAVFKLFGNGINTARDDWVTDYDSDDLQRKVEFFLAEYSRHDARSTDLGTLIKWSRNLKKPSSDAAWLRNSVRRPCGAMPTGRSCRSTATCRAC